MIRETLSNAGAAVAERGLEIVGREVGRQVYKRLPHRPSINRIISRGILSHANHSAKPEFAQEEVDYSTDVYLCEIAARNNPKANH